MNSFAIVAIAYNRPHSLKRLLNSLADAKYNEMVEVPLIISIDWSPDSQEVYEVAEEFHWKYGAKRIIKHEKNLGLKKHVLLCGDLTIEYDSIAVFEDDIYVAPGFYQFSMSALDFYKENTENIAGISLYTPEWNQTANRFFAFEKDSSDTFFIQYAQSWGQVWTREWWNQFKTWLEYENDNVFRKNEIPSNVQKWPDNSSWLKYHIKYCIEKNKYFLYPNASYTTNFSEVGEHNNIATSNSQVNLFISLRDSFRFKVFDKSIKYDAFFEREDIKAVFKIDSKNISVDLYGSKKLSTRYILTSKVLDYKVLNSFGMKLRPHELNIVKNVEGNEFFLYDTHIEKQKTKKRKKEKRLNLYKIVYDIRSLSNRSIMTLNLFNVKSTLINRLKNKFI